MTNTKELMDLIDAQGIKLTHIAEVMGITEKTLYNKINNLSSFTAREVSIMCEILDIRNFRTVNNVFFAPDVDK